MDGDLPFNGWKMMIVMFWEIGRKEDAGDLLKRLMIGLWNMPERNVRETLRRVIEELKDEDGDLGYMLMPIALFALEVYQTDLNIAKVNIAIEIAELAAHKTPEAHPNRANILTNLGSMYVKRYENGGERKDLEDGIRKIKMAITVIPEGYDYKADIWNNLGGMLFRKYQVTGETADLEEAISSMAKAISATSENDPKRARWLDQLIPMLARQFQRDGNPTYFEEAISKARKLASVIGNGHPGQERVLKTLAKLLQCRYEQMGSIDDLEAAIKTTKMRASATQQKGGSEYVASLHELGVLLHTRYERLNEIQDLEEAITNVNLAIQAAPHGSSDRPKILSAMSVLLSARYHQKGTKEDLEKAIELGQAAITATPKSDMNLSPRILNLASILSDQYVKTGEIQYLEEAIKTYRLAVSSASEEHPAWIPLRLSLARALQRRYEGTSDIGSLQEAIKLVEATPKTHPDWQKSQQLLGELLFRRYEWSGNPTDMETSISIAEIAVQKAPKGHQGLPLLLSNLSYFLRSRYEQAGEMSDLEMALSRAREAVALTPKTRPDWPGWQNNVAVALFRRYERTKSLADLDEAILTTQLAISAVPKGVPEALKYFSNLGPMQSCRFKHTKNTRDLDDAILSSETAVKGAGNALPDRAKWLSNLGTLLKDRYETRHDVHDLDAAMLNSKMAVDATPRDHPDRASWLYNLANTQLCQYERTMNSGDLMAVRKAYEEAFECVTAPALVRVKAGRQASRVLFVQGEIMRASRLATRAVELIPSVCSRYLSREDQQNAITETTGLAAECCSMLLHVGDIGKALQQLEFGRGVILGYLIDNKSDLSQLRKDHSDLAEQYDSLRNEISRNMSDRVVSQAGFLQQRMSAEKALKSCLRNIRRKTGYEKFLLEPDLEDLKKAAKHGTIVIVNITDTGSHAIMISTSSIDAIPLPITIFDAPLKTEHANGRGPVAMLFGKRMIRSLPPEGDGESGRDGKLTQLLSWLWSNCVKLIFDYLKLNAGNSTGKKATRIWWIGTGMAGSLPFHAAGHHSENSGENTLSHAISSYTPTIKALTFARSRVSKAVERKRDQTSVLVVTMPDTPNEDSLHGVLKEKSAIEETIKGNPSYKFKDLNKPSVVQVISQLQDCDIVHFACHGWSDATNPSDSHLLLQSQMNPGLVDRLSVRQVSGVDLGRAWIAYLSACSTAEIKVAELSDEGIHLASAFQIAGFGNVIGSLWPADDETCVSAARNFYASLSKNEVGNTREDRSVAEALHDAVLQIRSRNFEWPSLWAPYIHYGP